MNVLMCVLLHFKMREKRRTATIYGTCPMGTLSFWASNAHICYLHTFVICTHLFFAHIYGAICNCMRRNVALKAGFSQDKV